MIQHCVHTVGSKHWPAVNIFCQLSSSSGLPKFLTIFKPVARVAVDVAIVVLVVDVVVVDVEDVAAVHSVIDDLKLSPLSEKPLMLSLMTSLSLPLTSL